MHFIDKHGLQHAAYKLPKIGSFIKRQNFAGCDQKCAKNYLTVSNSFAVLLVYAFQTEMR